MAGSGAATRERILDAASELFYAGGIRATSADRVIERVGITKVTFYRHFRTKDDLVVAYLERRAAWERSAAAAAGASADDAIAALHAIAAGIGAESCRPGFRGCPFINAAAEYPDPEHPARRVADAHREWMRQAFVDLAREAGADDAEAVGGQLMMLRDGAMIGGYLGDPETVGATLVAAFDAVLRAGAPAAGAARFSG